MISALKLNKTDYDIINDLYGLDEETLESIVDIIQEGHIVPFLCDTNDDSLYEGTTLEKIENVYDRLTFIRKLALCAITGSPVIGGVLDDGKYYIFKRI